MLFMGHGVWGIEKNGDQLVHLEVPHMHDLSHAVGVYHDLGAVRVIYFEHADLVCVYPDLPVGQLFEHDNGNEVYPIERFWVQSLPNGKMTLRSNHP